MTRQIFVCVNIAFLLFEIHHVKIDFLPDEMDIFELETHFNVFLLFCIYNSSL